ncbi:MAG: C45 family peptidase [FCB group bacterium]|jgi:predicted choloylglycine hydrolase|nr:C45 family peptidase [FCB group bacterium]
MKRLLSLLLILASLGLNACVPKEAVPAPPPAPKDQAAPPPKAESLQTPKVNRSPEVKLLDREGAGELYQVGDLRVCVMEGTPEEMGFQQGRLLASSIRHMVNEGYLQKSLYARGYTPEYVNEQSERMAKNFPPEYLEEINGIEKGLRAAGEQTIGAKEIRTAATVAEIQHHAPNAPPQCSNFAVFGKWTTDGRLLHGRNLDWNINGSAQDDAVVLVWRPKGGTPFMMPTWAGAIGGVSGMNAKGITIGEMTSSTENESYDGLPLFLIMRRILEKASTLDEAVAIMQAGPRTLGWNFVVGDGKIPDARAMEVDAQTCDVFAPRDARESAATGAWAMEDAVRRTNHPCGETQLRKVAAKYGRELKQDFSDMGVVKELLKSQNTWQRYEWLGRQIEARPGAIDIDEALQLLSNGPVKNDATLHSWVLDPKNEVAYVANAGVNPVVPATETTYTKLDLREWFQ